MKITAENEKSYLAIAKKSEPKKGDNLIKIKPCQARLWK
jgi:hypothetical protein